MSQAAQAQSNRSLATDNGCFPWQDFKNGQCIAKPSQASPPPLPEPAPANSPPTVAPPPPPVPAQTTPCPDGSPGASGQCSCPVSTHYDAASARCVADANTRRPELTIVCDGGEVADGTCACPAGFRLMPAPGDAAGGTCIRTDAENCLGGELTESGKCLCNGQVTMSGETYLLEYSNGKCLPTRCPVNSTFRNGKCVTASSPELSSEPEKPRPAPRESRQEEPAPYHHCGRGMIRTHAGCVAARRRPPEVNASTLRQYYQNYHVPGLPPN